MKKVVIAVDPGRVNWAYSVLDTKGKIIAKGLWTKTIDELKDPEKINKDLKKFIFKVKKFFKLYDKYSYCLIYERMIPRSFNMKKNTAEIVNMCIGIFLSHAKPVKLIPVTAASWKNYRKKHKIEIKNKTIPEHITDSISMGHYFLLQRKLIEISKVKKLVSKISKTKFNWKKVKDKKLKTYIWKEEN